MKIVCPVAACGAENEAPITICTRCGADLRAYAIALKFPDLYFNHGLSLANAGDYGAARTALGLCLGLRPDDQETLLLYGRCAGLGVIKWLPGKAGSRCK